jgi:hypothetical protein
LLVLLRVLPGCNDQAVCCTLEVPPTGPPVPQLYSGTPSSLWQRDRVLVSHGAGSGASAPVAATDAGSGPQLVNKEY